MKNNKYFYQFVKKNLKKIVMEGILVVGLYQTIPLIAEAGATKQFIIMNLVQLNLCISSAKYINNGSKIT